jgi:hypothetical protein
MLESSIQRRECILTDVVSLLQTTIYIELYKLTVHIFELAIDLLSPLQ